MSATTLPAVRSDWLVARSADLLSTVGGAGASLLLLVLHLSLGVPSVVIWWTWVLLLDGPHIFATLSRTYFDREERKTRRRLLVGSLGWFLVGPAAFALSAIVNSKLPFALFMTSAGIWAYWHVVRQHFGMMMLSKRKNGDLHSVDNRIDALALYGGLLAPFVAFALSNPTARSMLGLPVEAARWDSSLIIVAWSFTAVVVVLLALRQIQRLRDNAGINGPKLLLVGSAVAISTVMFLPMVGARIDFLLVFPLITAFHNVQYHLVVWFYHRTRYHGGAADQARFGWAPRLSANVAVYAACGVIFTVLYRSFGCGIGAHPGCDAFGDTSPIAGAAGLSRTDFAQAFTWGIALHHYYLDQKIWRPSRDPGLLRDLRLAPSPE